MAASIPSARVAPTPSITPWWVPLIQGGAAVLFGLLLLAAPGATLALVVQLLGMYWLVGGIVMLASIFVDRANWGWKLVGGILAVLAGLGVLEHPLWSTILVPATVVYLLGFGGLVYGLAALLDAFRGAGWGAGVFGALNIILGLILIANPILGGLSTPWVYGVLAVAGGIVTIVSAFTGRG
jgi:uncharacterized membrane protein HdeD (DUF308 family)